LSEPAALRLSAQTPEDLTVMSSAVQDALFQLSDAESDRTRRRFTVSLNRFMWERAGERPPFLRARSVLSIESVLSVTSRGVASSKDAPAAVAQVLSLRFEPDAEPPGGALFVELAGGGVLRLTVECLDLMLMDLGPTWPTRNRPDHEGQV
jgi:hypothetical protein